MQTNRNLWSQAELDLLQTVIFNNDLSRPATANRIKEVSSKLGRSAGAIKLKAHQLKQEFTKAKIKETASSKEKLAEFSQPDLTFYSREQILGKYYTPEVSKPKNTVSVQFPIEKVEVKDGFIIFHFNQTSHKM